MRVRVKRGCMASYAVPFYNTNDGYALGFLSENRGFSSCFPVIWTVFPECPCSRRAVDRYLDAPPGGVCRRSGKRRSRTYTRPNPLPPLDHRGGTPTGWYSKFDFALMFLNSCETITPLRDLPSKYWWVILSYYIFLKVNFVAEAIIISGQ